MPLLDNTGNRMYYIIVTVKLFAAFLVKVFVFFVGKAAIAQEGIDAGLMATELHVKLHGVFAAALLKNERFEFGSCLGIEDAFFLEKLEAVGIEHLGPEVGVIARGISVASEDMAEVGAAVAELHFLGHAEFLGY